MTRVWVGYWEEHPEERPLSCVRASVPMSRKSGLGSPTGVTRARDRRTQNVLAD